MPRPSRKRRRVAEVGGGAAGRRAAAEVLHRYRRRLQAGKLAALFLSFYLPAVSLKHFDPF